MNLPDNPTSLKIEIARGGEICTLCQGPISKDEKYFSRVLDTDLLFKLEIAKEHTNCESELDSEGFSFGG